MESQDSKEKGKKKLLYVSALTVPSARAHAKQIVKTVDALTRYFDVIFCIARLRRDRETIAEYYNAGKRFKVVELGKKPLLPHPISMFFYTLRVRRFIAKEKPDIIYLRDFWLAYFLSLVGTPFFFEAHGLWDGHSIFFKKIIKSSLGIISTNNFKRDILINKFGIPKEKVITAPNGVDIAEYEKITASKNELRKELNLPQDKIIFGFNARFVTKDGEEKGISSFIDSIPKDLPSELVFCFVGGTPNEVEKYTKQAIDTGVGEHVIIREFIAATGIAKYSKASDILFFTFDFVLKHLYSSISPVKLFEYMAAERPILAPRLPAITEVVDDSEVTFFDPGESRDFWKKVLVLFKGGKNMSGVVLLREKVKRFTWETKAMNVASFIERRCAHE